MSTEKERQENLTQEMSEKEVQQRSYPIEKDKKRDMKIEHLNLPPEDKNKLDMIIKGDEVRRKARVIVGK